METKLLKASKESIDLACELLKLGEVVAVPTETVYGLAGNGLDEKAVREIYEVKGRPAVKPLSLMVSGIVRMVRYPLAAASAARPIPVLPDVGSMMTEPSFNKPFSSASLIIYRAALSLTLPAGFLYSTFTSTLAFTLCAFSTFVTSTRGVFPMISDAPL